MSAHVLGRAQIAPLFAMCTIPGEMPSARKRSRHARKTFSWSFVCCAVKSSAEAKCVNVPSSSMCLHPASVRAKHSTSSAEIPSRFIPVLIFK